MSEYITLVASDGSRYVLPRTAACLSATVRASLDNEFLASVKDEVKLPSISGVVLEKTAEYAVCANEGTVEAVEKFNLPTELALEVLVAADYLQL